jgi:hypothetical protein
MVSRPTLQTGWFAAGTIDINCDGNDGGGSLWGLVTPEDAASATAYSLTYTGDMSGDDANAVFGYFLFGEVAQAGLPTSVRLVDVTMTGQQITLANALGGATMVSPRLSFQCQNCAIEGNQVRVVPLDAFLLLCGMF